MKSHAQAGFMCSIGVLCNPTTPPNFLVGDPLPSSHPRSLNNSLRFYVIHHCHGHDIHRISNVIGGGHGCKPEWIRCMEQGARLKRDRRYTTADHRRPLVLRVVLDATANGSGEGGQSTFDAPNKHLILGRMYREGRLVSCT